MKTALEKCIPSSERSQVPTQKYYTWKNQSFINKGDINIFLDKNKPKKFMNINQLYNTYCKEYSRLKRRIKTPKNTQEKIIPGQLVKCLRKPHNTLKMTEINMCLSITTLNINGLNFTNKKTQTSTLD